MIELLYKRRSVRKFKDRPVEAEKLEILVQSLLLSPSGKNKRPWNFIVIQDKEIIKQAEEAKPHGTTPLQTAPLVIAVTAGTDKSDVWIEDSSIASIVVQLTAESLGLKSCWVQIRKRMRADGSSSEDYMRELLKLDENQTVLSLIAVGYPDEELPPYTREDLDFSKVGYL
jgi:nitroreductase